MADIKSNEERSAILTRFIIIYITAVLMAVIPLYYLFKISSKTINRLKVSELSVKSQKKKMERYQLIMTDLDKFISENKMEKEFRNDIDNLFAFAKDSIDEKNLYKPLYLKIADLYETIGKGSEGQGLKGEMEKLKADYAKMETDYKQAEKDLKDCEKENLRLMFSNK